MNIITSTSSRLVPRTAWMAALVALTGCSYGEQFRGTDRSALMSSARVQWSGRERGPLEDTQRVRYRSTFEAGMTYTEGDFDQEGLRPDYAVSLGHAVFAPEFTYGGARLSPRVGPAYGDVEVTATNSGASETGLGVMFGVEGSWQGWSWCEPYVRYTNSNGFDWRVGRFEVGVDLRVTDEVGFQVAYGRQTSEIDEVSWFLVGDSARIETEGVHLGLSLRF